MNKLNKKKLKKLIKILKTANDEEIREVFRLVYSYSFIYHSKNLSEEFNELEKDKEEISFETEDRDIKAYQGFLISYIEMRQRKIKEEMEKYKNETTTIE